MAVSHRSQYIDDVSDETNYEAVIKSMLTEGTGRHMLDSGGAYGRHWEENQKNSPWEKDRLNVYDEFVVMNIYDWLVNSDIGLERTDNTCEREKDFYEFCDDSGSWLSDMEDYAEMHNKNSERGFYGDVVRNNTYNGEFHSLSQCVQTVSWNEEGTYYVLLQVHQGADIRGGYTKPRLFTFGRVYDPATILPSEFQFSCQGCNWYEAESCIDYDEMKEITNPEENEVNCPDCGETISIY